MIIKKALNNNVAVAEDEMGNEVVVMGKGLIYGLKKGDDIIHEKIDKIFTITDKEMNTRFVRLLGEISFEYLELAEISINVAKEKLGKKLSNSIYISLTDHISSLAERASLNAYIKNSMLWDIKRLYRDEYNISLAIVDQINEKLNSHFDENEAATIAMHFVNAELETDLSTTVGMTKAMMGILDIVGKYFNIEYDEESLDYYRFVTHLKFFTHRLFFGNEYIESQDFDLFDIIKSKYRRANECVVIIKEKILADYNYTLEPEECMYLTIHIAKIVRNNAAD